MPMVNFYELPKDMQEKVIELATHFPFSVREVVPYYLMGGDHTDKLLELKAKGAPDVLVQMYNQELWDEKNKGLWSEIEEMNSIRTTLIEDIARTLRLYDLLHWLNGRICLYLEAQERIKKRLLQFLSKFRS